VLLEDVKNGELAAFDGGENDGYVQCEERMEKMMVVVEEQDVEINGKLNSQLGRGFGYRAGHRVFPYLV
jgi:hypothetical protein